MLLHRTFAFAFLVCIVAARPGSSRTADDPNPLHIKLIYYRDLVLRAQVTIGTPGQTVDLMLDTTSSDTIVIDPYCMKETKVPCIDDSAFNYTRKAFNKKNSSSLQSLNLHYKRTSRAFTASYVEYNDTFSISGAIIPANFGIADMVSSQSDVTIADGVLGLGLPLSGAMGPSVIGNLSTTYQSGSDNPNIVVLWVDDFAAPNGKGYLTVGDYDYRNCENDDLVNATLSSQNAWEFSMNGGWQFGTSFNTKPLVARVDTTTRYVLMPQASLNLIAPVINATWDPTIKSYFLPCEGTSTLPDFVFVLNGKKFNIPVVEYVKSYQGTNRCEFLFNVNTEWEQTHYGPQIRLGHPWLRSYCTVFNYAKPALGFTKAHHFQ